MNGRAFPLIAVLSILFCTAWFPPAATQPTISPDDLKNLSNDDLLKKYFEVGTAAGSTDAPLQVGNPAERDANFLLICNEIVARGESIVPLLCQNLLRQSTDSFPVKGSLPAGFMRNEIRILDQIHSPASIPALLAIAENYRPPMMELPNAREEALGAIEVITQVTFHRMESNHSHGVGAAIDDEDALATPYPHASDYPAIIEKYKKWLAGKGKNADQWFHIAERRCHAILKTNDIVEVIAAAEFLSREKLVNGVLQVNDLHSLETVPRITAILKDALGNPPTITKETSYDILHLVSILAEYGPRARGSAPLFINLQNLYGANNWSGYMTLGRVGGPRIMKKLVDLLPEIADHAAKNTRPYDGHEPDTFWQYCQICCRNAFDRWAGRHFDSDEQRTGWWQTNKEKTAEAWLTDSLPLAIARAKENRSEDVELIRLIIPQMQGAASLNTYLQPSVWPAPHFSNTIDSQKWYDEHRSQLVYDADTGTFLLRP